MPPIESTNPSRNYSLIDTIESTPLESLSTIVTSARNAQKSWAKLEVSQRVQMLETVYQAFDQAREPLAMSLATEMGMPIRQARDEVQYGMMYFRWYLDHADENLTPEITRETEQELHIVIHEPHGVVVAIAPWNYPFSMMIWTCMQALLAGNSVIFKTSKECILTGRLIDDLIRSTSIPDHIWIEIYGSGALGDAIVRENIDFITFTGSTRVGQWLASIALEKHIGCVMELGGSAPGIVCADADLEKVLETIYFLRFSNAGQMCDGLKRLIVHQSRYDEVVEKLSKLLLSKKIGDALDESTDIGPLVSSAQLEHFEEQYLDALGCGAKVFAELPIPLGLEGAYVTPRILGNISPEMLIWQEEVFGPMLPIVPYETIDEAIELANDTIYGLGAYVFTEDTDLFRKIATSIQSGMVQMNMLNYCIPESPFGGYKQSGIGREHGKWGFHEFTKTKVMSIPK